MNLRDNYLVLWKTAIKNLAVQIERNKRNRNNESLFLEVIGFYIKLNNIYRNTLCNFDSYMRNLKFEFQKLDYIIFLIQSYRKNFNFIYNSK